MSLRQAGSVRSDGCDLYYEEAGEGIPILLIPPSGSTASTWGAVVERLARIGRVITYDRRGYARSGGEPAQSMSAHTEDAAAILESLAAASAVVVGTSAGAAIAVDLAVRRPDLVREVVAHEFPWRYARHVPSASQVVALARIGLLTLLRRDRAAVETLLRSAYSYRDGGSAWDAFPEEWREAARADAKAALADFRNSIGVYPSAADLATVEVSVVCSYGARSPNNMVRLVRALALAIPGATTREIEGGGHAAPFDATGNFVELIAEVVRDSQTAMQEPDAYLVHPIGVVRSTLRAVGDAPNQAFEGAPEAMLEIDPALADALERIEPGDELVVLTWLHLADRGVLLTHPTGDERIPLTGVFRTRSPDRPNPIGVHRVTVNALEGPTTLRVGALEAIDGTPILDLKIMMDEPSAEGP